MVPSSAMLAVLEICVTPAATGLTTVTANVAVWLPPPAATAPMASVQVEPALLFGAQTQPAVLAPALNVVFAGTVSVSTTPVAPRLPALPYVERVGDRAARRRRGAAVALGERQVDRGGRGGR